MEPSYYTSPSTPTIAEMRLLNCLVEEGGPINEILESAARLTSMMEEDGLRDASPQAYELLRELVFDAIAAIADRSRSENAVPQEIADEIDEQLVQALLVVALTTEEQKAA